MECFAHPSQEDTVSGLAGTTSATGRPNRVTRTGSPVRRTPSRTAKQVALNLEIAISCIFNLYHSPIPWSECHLDAQPPFRPLADPRAMALLRLQDASASDTTARFLATTAR